ncbi:MAG: AAA family ATPase [Pseudomonadota bacterium]
MRFNEKKSPSLIFGIYSLPAEQAVLGGLLLNNASWPKVRDQLSFKDFYQYEHQILFQLIAKKLEKGDPIDALILSEEIKNFIALKKIKGEHYVFELIKNTPSTANIATYATIVKEHAQRRELKKLLDSLQPTVSLESITNLVKIFKNGVNRLENEKKITHKLIYRCFIDIPTKPIDWLWPHYIAKGKLSIIAGNPGLGKSQITASLAAIISTGGLWPVEQTACNPGQVIFLSAEDNPEDTIKPRLQAANADLTKIFILDDLESHDKEGRLHRPFNLKTDLKQLEYWIKTNGKISLVVIDPISAYLGMIDSHKNSEVRSLLSPLSKLAAQYNIAIIGISHLNKSAHTDPLMRVSGSLAFVAAARATYLVAMDPHNEDRRLFLPMKNNIGNDKTGFAFSIQAYRLKNNIESSKIVWENEIIHTKAYEVMTAPQSDFEDQSALNEAKTFLLDLLTISSRSVKEIQSAAYQAGHAWRTVRRAKDQLKIMTKKQSMVGGWFWELR